MDAREAAFAAKLLETFKGEAQEHLHSISQGLLLLEKNPSPQEKKETLETIFREAHSLKGGSRAVNLQETQEICQSLEDVLEALKKEKLTFSPPLFDVLYLTVDLVEKLIYFPADANREEVRNAFFSLIQKLEAAKKGLPLSDLPATPPLETPAPFPPAQEELVEKMAAKIEGEEEKSAPSPRLSKKEEAAPPKKKPSSEPETTIRVATSKLDRLLQQVEETLLIKLTSSQSLSELLALFSSFKEWDKERNRIQLETRLLRRLINEEAAEAHQNELKHSFQRLLDFYDSQELIFKDFDERFQRLSKIWTQDNRMIGGMIDILLEETKKLLMQPIATITEAFPRMARDIARALGKEINFQVEGGEIEIDRRILEEIKDPLIHMIRNSIDHGIESPQERQKKGKPPAGTIKISVVQISGGSVEIHVSDDGQGISLEKVKQAAIKQGVLEQKEATDLKEKEALSLIFQSGVSTSSIITEISGRGLGMGIVSEKIEKLGGQITIDTKRGQGTTFTLCMPIALATFRGVHIRTGGYDFIIPTVNIKRALRIKAKDVLKIENKEALYLDGKSLSFVSLAQILDLPVSFPSDKDAQIHVLILKALDVTIALSVDEVLTEQEVFIKGLGKQLLHIRNVAAATVMEGGKVIPILDPFDLIKSVMRKSSLSLTARPQTASQQKIVKKKKHSILLVEDSITARMLLKNILDAAGYEVKTAVDGAEAFPILLTEEIDLLLSDVEMPRMNGFELAKKVRQNEKTKDLPIVLCTSLGSREDRERGIEAGANAYIDKNSFVQNNLIEIIQNLL